MPQKSSSQSLLCEAVALLEQCEFADTSGGEYVPSCAICEGRYRHHKKGCELHAFLCKVKSKNLI